MGINIVTSASGAPLIAWMGHSPNTGVQGFWAQRCWIGGTSETNAPLVADYYGNLSLNGTLAVTNTATIGPTVIYGTSSSEYAIYLTTMYTPRPCADVYSVKLGPNARAVGVTEDVNIVAPGGATYSLHFKGGIYTGRTSLS
jgi:hypothetical protein